MTLKPLARKITLIIHTLSSVGLLGSIATFFVLALATYTSIDRSASGTLYSSVVLVTVAVVVPFAFMANMSGLLLALATPWGLFQHRWVAIKFWITLVATAVLLIKLRLIFRVADCHNGQVCLIPDVRHGELELVVHAAAGFLVLLLPLTLSIFKPRGLTRFGAGKLASRGPK